MQVRDTAFGVVLSLLLATPAVAACSEADAQTVFLELNAKTADMLSDGTPIELMNQLQGRLIAAQSRMMAAAMRGDIQTECDEVARLQAAFRQAGVR